MECDILSSLRDLCPQSLRRNLCHGCRGGEEMRMFDPAVNDFDRFFNELEFVIDLDFIQSNSKSLIGQTLLQVRDVKCTVNFAQLLREFKTIGNGSYFGNDLERSDVSRIQLSPFAKMYNPFPWRRDEGTSSAFDLRVPMFFNELEFIIDLDFIQSNSKSLVGQTLLQV
ncbi:hypothetical protein Tco_1128312 [Tanacetum coccineum]